LKRIYKYKRKKKKLKENIDPFLDSDNWFNYKEFYNWVAKKDFNRYVELGVWKGHSIIYLANQLKSRDVEIFAVDLWDKTYKYDDQPNLKKQKKYLYEIYKENVRRAGLSKKIIDIKSISWEAANFFEDCSVDFVFIDADHSLKSVKKDINSWLPKIRNGGIISGHDYFNPCGVKEAVDGIFGHKTKFYGPCWYVEI
jgi:predicted O-methyltransferase YrrM